MSLDVFADSNDLSSTLMTHDQRLSYRTASYASVFPVVEIRPANSSDHDFDEDAIVLELRVRSGLDADHLLAKEDTRVVGRKIERIRHR